MPDPTGGELLVRTLAVNGVERVFCVPGESFLAALDAFYDEPSIRVITCRHEAGAGNMAEATAKLSGRPGIAFVTRGPGATRASIAVHTARHDSTPLVLFIGQVGRDMRGREAFQEIDYGAMFGAIAKEVIEVPSAARMPELVTRALRVAQAGRPGPVVVALPEDVLRERAPAALLAAATRSVAQPAPDDVARVLAELRAAQRPLLLLGGGAWSTAGYAAIARFAERTHLATAASFRRQTLLDNRSPVYVGDVAIGTSPALERRLAQADLIVALGARLGEIPSGGYQRLRAPRTAQRLVHILPEAEELGRVFEPDVAVVCDPAAFAVALERAGDVEGTAWRAWTAAAREEYLAWTVPDVDGGAVDLARVVRHLAEALPDDAIVTNGAGNFAAWLHRFFTYKLPHTELAPTSGAMGYAVPAAIAAKLAHPERVVVGVAGDGDFLMSAQELATAIQYRAAPVLLVVNNGMYGTIRMHQERHYPERVIATDLHNPDFVALAQAFGAYGVRVTETAAFAGALDGALASGRAAVIELVTDAERIAPRATIGELRARAAAR